jgi:predicted glycosyltransferase
VSEGATIASEAGVMGVPNIYVNPLVRCYNKDLESYGLAVNITGFDAVSRWINKLLDGPSEKTEWQRRRQKMLSEKIDVTALLVWFVENYPESVRIMKEDPGYQWRFK